MDEVRKKKSERKLKRNRVRQKVFQSPRRQKLAIGETGPNEASCREDGNSCLPQIKRDCKQVIEVHSVDERPGNINDQFSTGKERDRGSYNRCIEVKPSIEITAEPQSKSAQKANLIEGKDPHETL